MAMNDHRNPDGSINGVTAMAEMSGLTPDTVKSLWAEVKANHAKLEACPLHDFEPATPGTRKRRCRNCGGEVGTIEVSWYEAGLRAGADGRLHD